MECVCTLRNQKESFLGISRCSNKSFRAKVCHQLWIGYEPDITSHDNLLTAYCPNSFCAYSASSYAPHYLLPDKANKSLLDKFICRNGRTGKICGSCKANYSVYFHSPNYLCKENNLCSLGWLFYFLSEILILIIIFGVILSFNISFTSGTLNGFMFYAQIIDILSVSAVKHKSNYPFWTIITTKVSIFTYNYFNLNFFHLDTISFCLWEGATTLDIIAMKYLTIVFAFFLVICVFIFMNFCTFGNLKYYSKRLKLQQSVIHGISTFLVTCFAQTVKITFHIFSPASLTKRGGEKVSFQVYYNGDLTLFGANHLKYVIPGLILFFSVVVIPTFFLMCYPLGFKALYRCGLSETKITKLHQIFCIFRLKPLFDSFQGCYKDQYRCFAGLYFIYRIVILASYSYSYGTTQFYVLVQVLASIMLLVHCLSHPYKRKIHNALDTLLFTNIAIVNGLSAFIYSKSEEPLYPLSVHTTSALQTLLIGLPLILLCIYTICKIISKLKVCRRKKVNMAVETESEDIPFRLLEERCEAFPPAESPTTN